MSSFLLSLSFLGSQTIGRLSGLPKTPLFFPLLRPPLAFLFPRRDRLVSPRSLLPDGVSPGRLVILGPRSS